MTQGPVTPVARAVVHPLTLVALAILLVNDHVLKAAFPGPITGKLSDFAGLAFIPVVAAFALQGRSVRSVVIAALVVCGAFAAVKTSQAACDVYAQAVGTVRWILAAPVQILRGEVLLEPSPGVVMCDPTDLVALPFGLIGVILTSRAAKSRAHCASEQTTHIAFP